MEIISKNLNLKQIADSGQCFRMNKIEENCYSLVAFGDYLELIQIDDNKILLANETSKGTSFWKGYFDLNYDYGAVVKSLSEGNDTFLKEAAEFGSGLRILRQDPFEMLISFIISQNKNIPAIKNAVERLCQRFGDEKICPAGIRSEKKTYHTFPNAKQLSGAKKEDLRSLGLGYRDEYVLGAARAANRGDLDLEKMKSMDAETLMEKLMLLKGVGKKVASCVALFGFHKLNVAPVDVWINRIDKEMYDGRFPWDEYSDIAGLVQQYMFYYIRNMSNK